MLAMNCGTKRNPDWWLLCAEEFSAEELEPHAEAMRKRGIAPLPEGTFARWGRLYSKVDVLAVLAAHSPSPGEGE